MDPVDRPCSARSASRSCLERGRYRMMRAVVPDWFVYMLKCGDGSLYTGIARDVDARLAKHRKGSGARYTRGRAPLELIFVEPAASKGDALRRGHRSRKLSRRRKLELYSFRPGI